MPLPSSIIMTKPSCKSEPAAPLLNHRPFTLSPLWEKKGGSTLFNKESTYHTFNVCRFPFPLPCLWTTTHAFMFSML